MSEAERRVIAFARIRGGLRDLHLGLKSDRAQRTLRALYFRNCKAYPLTLQPYTPAVGWSVKPIRYNFLSLPTEWLEKFADRIELELLKEAA